MFFFNPFTASKSNPERRSTGMSLLLVFFPDEDHTAATSADKRGALLSSSPTNSSTATAMINRSSNSGVLFSKAQHTISICLLLLFLTLLIFALSTFEPSAGGGRPRTTRRFLSEKPPSDWRFAMWDSSFSRHNRSRAPFALQRMGALFRRGSRAMNDLVVAHVGDDVSDDEFTIFLRILHRSGVTAKADVVFVFGSSSLLSRFAPVIENENRHFSKLIEWSKQNPRSTRNSPLGFDSNPFVKSSKKEMTEPLWGKKPRTNYSESTTGEDGGDSTRVSYGSVIGFEADELDPENSLAGFLDHVPMSLRRWACYPMLLGRLRRAFKHVLLADVKNLLLVGDPLGRVRGRSPESVYLFRKHGGKKSSDVNPVLLVGGARGIRRVANAMVTEIVRAAVQRKKRSCSVSESVILSQLVGSGLILKNVEVMVLSESVPEASSLSHESKVIQRGNNNERETVNTMLRMQLCSLEGDISVYSDC